MFLVRYLNLHIFKSTHSIFDWFIFFYNTGFVCGLLIFIFTFSIWQRIFCRSVGLL